MTVFHKGQPVTVTTKRRDAVRDDHGTVIETRNTIKGPFVSVELPGGLKKSFRPVNVRIRA